MWGEVRKRLEINNERLLKGRFFDRWELTLTDDKKNEIIEGGEYRVLSPGNRC